MGRSLRSVSTCATEVGVSGLQAAYVHQHAASYH